MRREHGTGRYMSASLMYFGFLYSSSSTITHYEYSSPVSPQVARRMAGPPPRIGFLHTGFPGVCISPAFLTIRFLSVLQNVAPATALAPFLAPLSDQILGAEKAPEPKREENHGIDIFLILKSYAFLAPLSDPIFGSEKGPEPRRAEHNVIYICF